MARLLGHAPRLIASTALFLLQAPGSGVVTSERTTTKAVGIAATPRWGRPDTGYVRRSMRAPQSSRGPGSLSDVAMQYARPFCGMAAARARGTPVPRKKHGSWSGSAPHVQRKAMRLSLLGPR